MVLIKNGRTSDNPRPRREQLRGAQKGGEREREREREREKIRLHLFLDTGILSDTGTLE
jgi:hypothetical protein